ncbi:MAG TPA: iron-sulfur cluster assembly accessory protein [Candidatus Eisenbacteria bacterium]|jgi:iron-sulfur cluster assembly protein
MDLPIVGINSPAVKGAVQLSPLAASKVIELLGQRERPNDFLRIGVRGGGCSGNSYFMEFAEASEPADEVIESHGVKLLVDAKSAQLLSGTVVDFVEGLMGTGFKFNNPNVRHSCACGESFSA